MFLLKGHRDELLENWAKAQQAERLKKSNLWTNINAVTEFKVLEYYMIWIRFEDGFKSTVHLRPLLKKGIARESIL
jgi:hypothetical protein